MLLSAVAFAGARSVAAQARPAPAGAASELVLQAYTFHNQQASEAMSLVYPLLSPRGTLELQPAGNTLVIRDVRAAIDRILPLLRGYDHPPRPLRLEVYIVRASRTQVSPQIRHSDLPEWLTKRLRDLLAYDIFETQAQAQLVGKEGQQVVYDLGQEYRISFRFGTLLENGRAKLAGFRISRQGEGKAASILIQTNLNLWCDRTTSLGLAKSEASREALMVVLTLREAETARGNGGEGQR